MSPLISYVLPTYNRVAWVGEAIQGLLSQTVNEIEVIVVDDASNDGSNEMLQWFADKEPRFRLVTNAKNMGAGMSRNIGNDLAQAPIIGVCDSDDCYPMERTEETLRFFKENPEYRMMNAPYVRVNYFGEQMEEFRGEPFDEKLFIEKGMANYFCHPAAAYYKEDILAIGGYKSETKEQTDDYQLVKDWVASGRKIGFAKDAFLCAHRVLPSSIMAKMRGFDPKWAA